MTYTDEEIIKALEHCISGGDSCLGCPRNNRNDCCELDDDVMKLLKRQHTEIERLKNKIIEDDRLIYDRIQESINAVNSYNRRYVDALEKVFNDRTVELQSAKAEIENLNKRIKTAKSEAYKEFADRIKLKACPYPSAIGMINVVTIRAINDFVKEITQDD